MRRSRWGSTPMSLICASCGQANRDAARFCAGCGQGLMAECPACGAKLPPGARFCDACGAVVSTPDPVVSEMRKVVSVLFADLAGSTAMQETLDAESVRRVMARFYEVMRVEVERQDGRVEKLVGDAVVASFGARGLHEDDAVRAVRAADAMRARLVGLNEELERAWGVRLRMRAGVNTGELVVGDGGELVGDTMNTAARLEQAAGEGEVLVGEGTWRLVRHAVELQPVSDLELKGKAGTVRAWRLVSVSGSADGGRAAASDAPLVGRESELRRLRDAFAEVVSAQNCRLVTVMGSPGVGKTRLASELAAVVSDAANVVVGRCEPTGEGLTFLPVAEVLRAVAEIGEADAPDVVRAKLGALVPEDDPDRERLVERIAGVLGIAEPASAEETFWALRRGLEFLAAERPLVLVLDDLHWGQPMLLDLVEHLVEWVRDAPVLIVALARPELRESREALAFAGRRASAVVELEPLDEDESRELVTGLLGEVRVPPALTQRILQTTDGNPLFLGETVRMLVDEGVLRREGDAWITVDEAVTVEVPPTIQALLAARIERLRSEERTVVERAAVIGKLFYRGAVAELVAPPVRIGIDGHLESLRRKDMVEPDGTYWIDEPVFRFHHVLIRDAAYRSLLKEARADLHERFADWMELKAGELVGEHEEVIAFHLEQAHAYRRELGPLNEHGRRLGTRAASRLHSAGRRALAREDLAAAANLLGRALACGTGDEQEILWDLCEAVLAAGDTSAAVELVQRFSEGGDADPQRRARATVIKGQLANLTGAGEIAATAEQVAAAAAELAALGDRMGEAKGCQVAAGAYARLGRVALVEEALDRALAAARSADDARRTTAVLAGAPRAALWGPSPVVRASGRCLDVVRILRMTPGNRHVEAIALRCQAVLEAMRGRADAAREIIAAGRATLEELGLAYELHETAVHAGIVELLDGSPAAAAAHLRAARDGFQALGVSSGAAQAAALLARALVEEGGNDDEALEQTRFAEQHGGEDLKTAITWMSARAQALARMGEFAPALEVARRAVSLAEPTDALADKGDASMALAEVLAAAGMHGEALEAARAAGAWYEAKGHTVGAARVAAAAGAGPAPTRSFPAEVETRAHGPSTE
ncbi:MAG: AAA family ATPase, partial [Solirubrobacteraceae bacterium]